jgi:hypothetical protein
VGRGIFFDVSLGLQFGQFALQPRDLGLLGLQLSVARIVPPVVV